MKVCRLMATLMVALLWNVGFAQCGPGEDMEAPMAVAIDPALELFADTSCAVTIYADLIDGGSTDNCAILDGSAAIRLAGTMDAFEDSLIVDASVLDYSVSNPFPLDIEFTVMDEEGNADTIATQVMVSDTIAPLFVDCPEDVTISLDALACEATYEFALSAEDNCTVPPDGMVTIEQTAGPASGEVFPIGTTTVTHTATDAAGNITECSFDVTVEEFPVAEITCGQAFNLSLDESCTATVTPAMFLLGEDYGCLDSCTVMITNSENEEVDNIFDVSQLGQTFTAEVCCGGNCCWATFLVEDKFAPQIICESDTITCDQLFGEFINQGAPTPPMIVDNCSNNAPILLNETFTDVACTDTLLEGIITRTWTAIDDYGNIGDTCVQTLSLAKFDIGSVTPPELNTVQIECGSNYPVNADGVPDPVFYGSPQLGGTNIYPGQVQLCNTFVDYTDQITEVGPTTIVARLWTATYWTCGQDTSVTFPQLFTISDTQGPAITCPEDIITTVDGMDCAATVILPSIVATDICNEVVNININYGVGFLDQNGGTVEMPKGINTVVYTATDTYGNASTCEMIVTVTDDVNPIAIADAFTKLSLTDDGTATLKAIAVDDGSFDECTDVQLYVKRMDNGASCDPTDKFLPVGNDNAQFNEAVHFCCADIGSVIMVQFMVCDDGDMNGVFNSPGDNCSNIMVEVMVEDKMPPILVADLPDITVSCEFPIDPDNLDVFGSIATSVADREDILITAEYVEFNGEAKDALIVDNCGHLVSDELFNLQDINMCGTGDLTRVLVYGEAGGANYTVVQNITIINVSPFVESDINWPNDYLVYNMCGVDALHPENLSAQFSYPTFTEDNCDQVALTWEDEVTDFSNGSEACFTIARTWTFADWCQQEGGEFVTFEHIQYLEVQNLIDPIIDGDCTDKLFESVDNNCADVFVNLVNSASDDCTSDANLIWSYIIDIDSDGFNDIQGNTADASGVYPLGIHTIYWNVSDQCSNDDACSYTFEVVNLKLPTPYCLNNVSTDLGPVDEDGDGTPDYGEVTINTDLIDAGSFHSCGYDVVVSFSADVNDVERTYNCNHVGEQPLQLWVTDENGNQDFCTTSIIIEDNFNYCSSPPGVVDVVGDIYTEEDEMVGKVAVELVGGSLEDMTEDDGHYEFMEMPTGGTYSLVPSKDNDHINGVSTLDLIIIQKHILNISPITSPYKLLAADVNHSDNISGTDLIQIRKLLLGLYDEFPNNTSWRFVDSDHVWTDTENPWASTIPETYELNNLNSNMLVNFHGVKIGDVNNTATPNQLIGKVVENRSNDKLTLSMDPISIENNVTTWVPVYGTMEGGSLQGYQVTLDYDHSKIQVLDMRSEVFDIRGGFNIDANTGTIRTNAYANEAVEMSGKVLFEIEIKAESDVSTENLFSINDQELRAEAYTEMLDINNIVFENRNAEVEIETMVQFEMNQNTPNPWSGTTIIDIQSPISGSATFRVLDLLGRQLTNQELVLTKGMNTVELSSQDYPASGVYYYELQMNGNSWMKKMILVK